MKYLFKKIEPKWQAKWEEAKVFEAKDNSDKPKFYGLVEFPYPSGAGMHVGHIKAYSSLEVISRKRRMEGYNVLFPIGFDAFGLPTENYAVKTGTHPRIITDENIKRFSNQLKKVGFSFDWNRVIEESPCIAISDDLRKKMGETAVRAAKAAGYESAGTIEFLLDQSGEFYFMEMNTRIQVEHPVTEFVSGVDLIKEQICIAAGEPLSVQQKDIEIRGHAMECRINAEDPERHFMPCPGKITDLHLPGGNGIRVDTAVYNDYAIPPYYDSMIAKIIVYDKDRRSAIRKMISALGEVAIEGVKTNVDFLYELLNQPDFQEGNITTDFIPQHYPDL